MGEKFIMKLSTYIKSNSIKTISILVLCLTLFVVLFGVGCSTKKDGDIEVQATVTNIERGYDKFERKKYERHFVTYTANGKTYTSILNGDVSDLKIGDIISAYYSPEKPDKISRPMQNQSYVVIIGIASFLIIDFIITVILRKKGILNKHRYIPKNTDFNLLGENLL